MRAYMYEGVRTRVCACAMRMLGEGLLEGVFVCSLTF